MNRIMHYGYAHVTIAILTAVACAIYRSAEVIYSSFTEPARFIAELVMTPFRLDWGYAASQSIASFKPAAFRVIGTLKPLYRDSYATNGQSLGMAAATT